MVSRNNTTTAVNLMASHGALVAARFLDKHKISVDVSLRVLGQTLGSKREAG